jgi:hypothetical protein
VLFLGGLGRSGTTLLERILGELPGVCPLGEVVHLWRRDVIDDERCGCGERFSACEFWRKVGAEAFGGWTEEHATRVIALRAAVERTRHLPALAAPRLRAVRARLVNEYTTVYRRVYQAAAEVSGSRVVIDSSKHASLAFCLRWCPDIDLRVVHMVRDSRGVAYSWTKQTVRPESDDGAEMTRYPPVRSAMLWNALNAAFGVLERLGTPVHRLRYEEFLADPVAAVEAIRRSPTCHPTRARSASSTPVRPASAPATARPATRCASPPARCTCAATTPGGELSAPQRRLVGALTAPLLGAYGYPLSGQDDT